MIRGKKSTKRLTDLAFSNKRIAWTCEMPAIRDCQCGTITTSTSMS